MLVPSLVVCAADTGDGKTWVATRLVAQLREQGVKVAVCKPLESGVGSGGPADALALCRAAGWGVEEVGRVCPWPLPRPVAPAQELERLGLDVTPDGLRQAVARAAQGHGLVVVETAGGVRSPLAGALTSLDVALLLEAPVLLVVADRLGAISRAVCAARECDRAGARVLALALNRRPDEDDPSVATNHAWIARQLPALSIARIGLDAALPAELLARVLALSAR